MAFEDGVNIITDEVFCMLNTAEEMFGLSASNQTFIGVRFREGNPLIFHDSPTKISISLTSGICNDGTSDYYTFCYQLAHEVCHLLFANGDKVTNALEEGIATYFSIVYFDKIFPNSTVAIDYLRGIENYYKAYDLVNRLISDNSKSIILIREIAPVIKGITFDQLKALNFNLNDEEIRYLVSVFRYNTLNAV